MKKTCFAFLLILAVLSACQSKPQPLAQVPTVQTEIEEPQPATLRPEPTATSLPPTPTPLPPTPTSLPPTETSALSPEVLAGSIADLVGTWKGRWSDKTSVYLEIKDGTIFRTLFPNGDEIARGYYTFEDGLFTFRTDSGPNSGYCDPHADYEVYVTKQADQPVALRFVLVGEDDCVDRKDYLDGKTLQLLEP